MANNTRILLLLLLSSSILIVADQQVAPAATTQLSPDAETAVIRLKIEINKIINVVVSPDDPLAKQKETLRAVNKHVQVVNSALDKAKESGDEKQILRIFATVKMAAAMINGAPPDRKLKLMEDQFNSVAAPDEMDCPNVDKAYCEMHAKIRKAVDGALAGMSDKEKAASTIGEKVMYPAAATINRAYADGDEKKIAQVLAAYSKAADEVIAAAPADKLKVLEKTFAAAAAASVN